MSERKTKTLERSLGGNVSIEEVEEAIAKCRSDGFNPVEFEVREDYDYHSIVLRFTRPETDEEMRGREANEKRWAADQIERERKQFEELKKKFEAKS